MDRETLIGAIEQRKRIAERNNQAFVDLPYEIVGEVLELLKEQEAKTGHWENGHCTCCGEDIASHLDTWTDSQSFAYCPKCGAKMEGR